MSEEITRRWQEGVGELQEAVQSAVVRREVRSLALKVLERLLAPEIKVEWDPDRWIGREGGPMTAWGPVIGAHVQLFIAGQVLDYDMPLHVDELRRAATDPGLKKFLTYHAEEKLMRHFWEAVRDGEWPLV